MMDDFEKNIRDNQEFFNEPAPDKMKMWANIERRLPMVEEKKVIPLWRRTAFRAAAAILFLVGLTFMFFQNGDQSKLIQKESTAFNDLDSHYGKLVALQIIKLKNSNELSKDEKNEFLSYIEELNLEQEQLKKELATNLNNEEILEAIIRNFNQQINLIEQLLDRLNQSKIKSNDQGISL